MVLTIPITKIRRLISGNDLKLISVLRDSNIEAYFNISFPLVVGVLLSHGTYYICLVDTIALCVVGTSKPLPIEPKGLMYDGVGMKLIYYTQAKYANNSDAFYIKPNKNYELDGGSDEPSTLRDLEESWVERSVYIDQLIDSTNPHSWYFEYITKLQLFYELWKPSRFRLNTVGTSYISDYLVSIRAVQEELLKDIRRLISKHPCKLGS